MSCSSAAILPVSARAHPPRKLASFVIESVSLKVHILNRTILDQRLVDSRASFTSHEARCTIHLD